MHRSQLIRVKMLRKDTEVPSHISVSLHKELTVNKAEYILGTSGDTRILSLQLRDPVTDQ